MNPNCGGKLTRRGYELVTKIAGFSVTDGSGSCFVLRSVRSAVVQAPPSAGVVRGGAYGSLAPQWEMVVSQLEAQQSSSVLQIPCGASGAEQPHVFVTLSQISEQHVPANSHGSPETRHSTQIPDRQIPLQQLGPDEHSAKVAKHMLPLLPPAPLPTAPCELPAAPAIDSLPPCLAIEEVPPPTDADHSDKSVRAPQDGPMVRVANSARAGGKRHHRIRGMIAVPALRARALASTKGEVVQQVFASAGRGVEGQLQSAATGAGQRGSHV